MGKETDLSLQVSKYLSMQYPNLIYHFDLSSGGKLPMNMAVRNKRMNKWTSYPDLFICQPNDRYHGLFLELKAVDIYKKDGSLRANEHVEKQNVMLNRLKDRGYCAMFAIGFDDVKKKIDNYLSQTF
jgi:hypothetical protein